MFATGHALPMLGQLAEADLEKSISDLSWTAIAVASVALVVLVCLAIWTVKKWPELRAILFSLIAFVVAGTTLLISGSTVYLNLNSATGGPVHWHADIEFWACGNELNIRDPDGLSNKIGTPVLHEHNDKRIHLEGVPTKLPYDASLGKFMTVIGGEVTKDSFTLPLSEGHYFEDQTGETDGDGPGASQAAQVRTNIVTGKDGMYARFVNGQMCGDEASVVQAFVYRLNPADNTYTEHKLADPANYEISHQEQVPPGDCIIVEFSPSKDHTDKLCRQYGIRDKNRCDTFGVPADDKKTCTIQERLE